MHFSVLRILVVVKNMIDEKLLAGMKVSTCSVLTTSDTLTINIYYHKEEAHPHTQGPSRRHHETFETYSDQVEGAGNK